MKLAVIFLCVALASFIDTSEGNSVLSLTKINVQCQVRAIYDIGCLFEKIKLLSGPEQQIQIKILLHKIIYYLQCLALDFECTLEYLLQCLGFPPNLCDLILAGDVDAILALGLNTVEVIVVGVSFFVQVLLAKLGFVLSTLLTTLDVALGGAGILFPILSGLLPTVTGILSSVTDPILKTAFGLLTVLGNILG